MSLFASRPPQSLCILRLSAIGDVTHMVPVVRTLQSIWPKTKITWIIGKLESELVMDIPGIEFIIFDKKQGWGAYKTLKKNLHNRQFDLLLNMQSSLRASLASTKINAPIKLGFDRERAKDYQWMLDHTAGYEVTVTDVSEETYMIALQGPKAIELLQKLTPTELADVSRFSAFEDEVGGIPAIVGRTGYTGEDGVEIFCPADQAVALWGAILNKGMEEGIEVKPIGLAARDSLRFEPSFALYGHEIGPDITPLEANLGWVCKLGSEFIGQEALLKQKEKGVSKKLVGFELTEKGMPREGYSVANKQAEEIGTVVTGVYGPTIGKYCGHAFIDPAYAKPDTEIKIVIRNKPKAAVVVKRPFYIPAYR